MIIQVYNWLVHDNDTDMNGIVEGWKWMVTWKCEILLDIFMLLFDIFTFLLKTRISAAHT